MTATLINSYRYAALGGTFTLFASANGGYIASESEVDYASALTGGELVFAATTNPSVTQIGQDFTSGEPNLYSIWVSFLEIDVSSITGTVSSATLALNLDTDASVENFTMQARTRDYGAGLTTADWIGTGAGLGALTLLATRSSVGIGAGYNNFTESGSALRSAVTTAKAGTGLLRMLVCSDQHVSESQPPDDQFVKWTGSNGVSKPRLTVVTV